MSEWRIWIDPETFRFPMAYRQIMATEIAAAARDGATKIVRVENPPTKWRIEDGPVPADQPEGES